MKRIFSLSAIVVIAAILLGACNFGQTPGADPATQVPATDAPAVIGAVTDVAIVPIDLAGPPMVVGSKYTYVDGSVLVAVPAGPFLMGNSNVSETPERTVTLSDYWIYSSEVTNGQFALCVNAGKCAAPDPEKNPLFGNYRTINVPVTGVNYQQSYDYCNFVKGRLPTEAEWEKAARGPDGNLFPWGDEAPSCGLLNFKSCKGVPLDIQSYPEGVSYYGLFDMAGNVREWAADWYSPTYYTDGPVEDPLGPQLGDKRSVRSNSYVDGADESFSAHRFSLRPQESLPDLGFRCVVENPVELAPMCNQLAYYGTGPDGAESNCTPSVQCNDVSIGFGKDCQGTSATTIVTFTVSNTPPDGWTHSADGCIDEGGDATYHKYSCTPGQGPASTTGSCMDASGCDPSCPAHYVLDGDTCKWDGSGTEGEQCLEGMTYDVVNQCCTATPGSGVDFAVCPAGYYPFNGACVKDPAGIVDNELKAVQFLTCTGGDTPCDPLKDPTCQPDCDPQTDPNCQPSGCPVQSCPTYLSWDSTQCCCAYQGYCTVSRGN